MEPLDSTTPLVLFNSPNKAFKKVVLPLATYPTTAIKFPFSALKFKFFRTLRSLFLISYSNYSAVYLTSFFTFESFFIYYFSSSYY